MEIQIIRKLNGQFSKAILAGLGHEDVDMPKVLDSYLWMIASILKHYCKGAEEEQKLRFLAMEMEERMKDIVPASGVKPDMEVMFQNNHIKLETIYGELWGGEDKASWKEDIDQAMHDLFLLQGQSTETLNFVLGTLNTHYQFDARDLYCSICMVCKILQDKRSIAPGNRQPSLV